MMGFHVYQIKLSFIRPEEEGEKLPKEQSTLDEEMPDY